MREIIIKITGYRPGCEDTVRRGVKIKIPDDFTPDQFLQHYGAAFRTLLRHEEAALGKDVKLDVSDLPYCAKTVE